MYIQLFSETLKSKYLGSDFTKIATFKMDTSQSLVRIFHECATIHLVAGMTVGIVYAKRQFVPGSPLAKTL